MDLNILQHYWWILICILGGLLVFLLFVQTKSIHYIR